MNEHKPSIVIDATNATLGRLASYVAKQSLLGKEIAIVNCSKAIITGRKRNIIDDYNNRRKKGGSAQKGPFFPKSPEKIMKRTIRGMLSYKQGRGLAALKRIRCYNQVPVELEAAKKVHAGKEKRTTVMELQELSREI